MLNSIKKMIPKGLKNSIKKTNAYKKYRNYKFIKGRNDKLIWSNSNNLKVLFIVQRIEVFTSSLPVVYEALNRGYDVTILASPRHMDHDDSFDLEAQNKTIQTISKWDIKDKIKFLEAYNFEKKEYNKLSEIYDYIFINMPYACTLPTNFDFKDLRKHGQLCVIPYGYSSSDNELILKGLSNDYILQQMNYYFCSSVSDYDYIKPLVKIFENNENKEMVYNIGFPRFELDKDVKTQNTKYTVLWIPRWTNVNKQVGNIGSSFLKYKDDFIKFALSHKELDFIMRPHPLMFDNYIANGIITKEEYQELLNTINKSDNLFLDVGPSYLDTFNKSDLLIADFSSIVAEFYVNNKPILYTGVIDEYSKKLNYITDSFYFVKSFNEIENVILNILRGNDPKKECREKSIKEFWKNNEINASKNILELLEADKRKFLSNMEGKK